MDLETASAPDVAAFGEAPCFDVVVEGGGDDLSVPGYVQAVQGVIVRFDVPDVHESVFLAFGRVRCWPVLAFLEGGYRIASVNSLNLRLV